MSRADVSLPGGTPEATSRHVRLVRPDGLFVAILGAVAVVCAAFSHGAYYPTAWGLFTIVAVWVIAARVVLGEVRLSPFEVAAVVGLASLAGWIAASSIWGIPERAILEAERTALYVSVLTAACVVLTRRALPALLTGVWAAVSVACGYGLLTRLVPERLGVFDPIGGSRLSEPLGYWNGLGVFAALGALLAVGLAARASTPAVRIAAAASLPLLVTTLYFTFSRGGWIALAAGLLAAIALDVRRLQLVTTALALAPAVAVALVAAYRSPALNVFGASPADAARDGHRLALVVGAAMVLCALVEFVLQLLERRASVDPRLRRGYAIGLVATGLVALLLVFVRFGSPPTLVSRAYEAFAAPPPALHERVSERLFSFSGSGRVPQWRVAWRAYEREPVLGSGAGTYEQSWNELRPAAYKLRNAHSLYLEMLSEVGPVGLALLLAALAIPVLAAIRARRQPLVSATLGAYTAFVVHAGVDWDWELPAVTFVGLLCAATLLVAAREERGRPLSQATRVGVVVSSLAVAAFSVVGVVGNRALANGEAALDAGREALAAEHAREALQWAPWSAQAHRLLAEAQLAGGNAGAARDNLRQAIASDPRDWTLWFALAQTTSGPEGAHALAEARRLNPRSPDIEAYVSANGQP